MAPRAKPQPKPPPEPRAFSKVFAMFCSLGEMITALRAGYLPDFPITDMPPTQSTASNATPAQLAVGAVWNSRYYRKLALVPGAAGAIENNTESQLPQLQPISGYLLASRAVEVTVMTTEKSSPGQVRPAALPPIVQFVSKALNSSSVPRSGLTPFRDGIKNSRHLLFASVGELDAELFDALDLLCDEWGHLAASACYANDTFRLDGSSRPPRWRIFEWSLYDAMVLLGPFRALERKSGGSWGNPTLDSRGKGLAMWIGLLEQIPSIPQPSKDNYGRTFRAALEIGANWSNLYLDTQRVKDFSMKDRSRRIELRYRHSRLERAVTESKEKLAEIKANPGGFSTQRQQTLARKLSALESDLKTVEESLAITNADRKLVDFQSPTSELHRAVNAASPPQLRADQYQKLITRRRDGG